MVKTDVVAFISVTNANPNAEPEGEALPRTDSDGYGLISNGAINRKLRNRLQDMGYPIFLQSDDRCDDGAKDLRTRAEAGLKDVPEEDIAAAACKKWIDVRTFGQVFAYGGKNSDKKKGKAADTEEADSKGVSIGVRGPLTTRIAHSVDPVEVVSMQITKSASTERKKNGARGSDTMGTKHFVRFGLYMVQAAICPHFADKTGLSEEDVEAVKEAFRTLFVNDASSSRPEGSMEVVRLFWFKHDCEEGQYPSAKVHRSVKAVLKEGVEKPTSVDDYDFIVTPLEGLTPEVIEGI